MFIFYLSKFGDFTNTIGQKIPNILLLTTYICCMRVSFNGCMYALFSEVIQQQASSQGKPSGHSVFYMKIFEIFCRISLATTAVPDHLFSVKSILQFILNHYEILDPEQDCHFLLDRCVFLVYLKHITLGISGINVQSKYSRRQCTLCHPTFLSSL